MKFKINIIFSYLVLLIILALPLATALSVSDTNFSAPDTNNSINVDSMTLTQIIITNETIEFYNVSSVMSNFTNTNDTYNATIDFYGLIIGLGILDLNTSSYVFNSSSGNQNYTSTIKPLQIVRIISLLVTTCTGILDTQLIKKLEDGIYPYVRKCFGIEFR